MVEQKNKNFAISFVRAIAMVMIIICHAFNENSKLSFLGQVFNVGVFTFIFLSGYLYGKKEINDIFCWLKQRAIRVLVPMYVFMIFLFIVRDVFLSNGLEFKNYLIYIFNIQGLLGGVQGGSHLWFLTAIMICYLITPMLDKLKAKVLNMNKIQINCALIVLLLIQIVLSYTTVNIVSRYVFYIILYTYAYYYSFLKRKEISKLQLIYLTILMILGLSARIMCRNLFDGTLFYTSIIVLYSQAVLGLWVFFVLSKISVLFAKVNKVVEYFDNLSFELYIVHYMFFVGPFRVMSLTQSFILNSIMALILSFISAVILNYTCKNMYSLINNKTIHT